MNKDREKAIDYLTILSGTGNITADEAEAIDIAISDMEKNIPKKPTPIDWEQYVGVIDNAHFLRGSCWCPNCEKAIKSGRYCDNCGQLLDWSDVE